MAILDNVVRTVVPLVVIMLELEAVTLFTTVDLNVISEVWFVICTIGVVVAVKF